VILKAGVWTSVIAPPAPNAGEAPAPLTSYALSWGFSEDENSSGLGNAVTAHVARFFCLLLIYFLRIRKKIRAMTINSITATIIPMATPGIPFDFATALEVVLDASLLAEGVTDGAEGVAVVRTIAGVLVGEGVEEEDVKNDV